MQNQHDKIRINCLEECNKSRKYQARYLVRVFVFIISTWCVYHAIHHVLQFRKSFDLGPRKYIF